MTNKVLNLKAPPAPAPPGRILDAAAVAALLMLERPESPETQRWVREHVPNKKRLGHRTVRWLERDVLAWVESRTDAA